MREWDRETIDGWYEFDSGRTYADLRFTNCRFLSCTLALDREDLSLRPRVQRVELRRCSIQACRIRAAVIEDVLVDCLKTVGLFQTWAAVFRHVTFRGKVDRVMFSPFFRPLYPTSSFQRAIARANADYYSNVDWALDIRYAEFKDFDCRGVPSRLVRRDPETQAIVTRERLLARSDALGVGGWFWENWLKAFLQDSWYEDGVLVVPKRSRRFRELLTGLHRLRREGVTEPD